MRTRFGICGSVLKWIAIVTMAIDHIGASILETFMMNIWGVSPLNDRFLGSWNDIYAVDRVLRYIGRPAFPIFCFLLVEGFVHTRNVKKYAIRLGIFALVSEIPFDLAFHVSLFNWEYQNVFFTLLIGLLVIWFMDVYGDTLPFRLAGIVIGGLLAELLNTDYGAFGVILIMVLYLLRDKRAWQCICGALCCIWELTAPLAFVFIWFYNKERGRQPKWFFYWFYPVHLLLYYFIGAQILPAVFL